MEKQPGHEEKCSTCPEEEGWIQPLDETKIEALLGLGKYTLEDLCCGSLLALMIGDILGAPVEGMSMEAIDKDHPGGILTEFIWGTHMGIRHLGPRFGEYTDDTEAALALASSLVEKEGLSSAHVSMNYYLFWSCHKDRGYPKSAQRLLRAIGGGVSHRETGTKIFSDGSFANGGAMRITPIGLAFRNATDEELYEAVKEAIVATHVHPEAVDGAFLQAKAVKLMLALGLARIEEKSTQEAKEHRGEEIESPSGISFDGAEFLKTMHSSARTEAMRQKIALLQREWKISSRKDYDDRQVAKKIAGRFQIKAIEAVPLVLWIVARHYEKPLMAMAHAIRLGGDTDTLAAMVGGIIGAVHGTFWIPKRLYDNIENEERGRDFCVRLGTQLSRLDLRAPMGDDLG